MVSVSSSHKPKRKDAVLKFISSFSYISFVLLCFLMIATVFDVDAPSQHGDLHEIYTLHEAKKTESKTVGYAVTITDCGTDGDVVFHIAEGAAVMAHSVKLAHAKSPFDYKLYAIYHPQAEACAHLLDSLNFTLVPRDTPVAVKDIKGDTLRERIEKNGCCGEKELIKLEAFTLTQHNVVVLLDLDVMIIQSLDRLFDFMTAGKALPPDDLQWPDRTDAPQWNDVSLLYTIDYAMVNPGRTIKPTQGGFLLLRPDMGVYEDLREIVRNGDFRDAGGWGGKSGKFWGAMTIQGLLPYYYKVLNHERNSIELNRWVYDNMCSPAKQKENQGRDGRCFTMEDKCEACGDRPLGQINLVHFTVCQKPWLCMLPSKRKRNHQVCNDFHHEWFRIRSDMEKSWGRSGSGPGKNMYHDHFFGYCDQYGTKGYQMIAKPYGHSLSHQE